MIHKVTEKRSEETLKTKQPNDFDIKWQKSIKISHRQRQELRIKGRKKTIWIEDERNKYNNNKDRVLNNKTFSIVFLRLYSIRVQRFIFGTKTTTEWIEHICGINQWNTLRCEKNRRIRWKWQVKRHYYKIRNRTSR